MKALFLAALVSVLSFASANAYEHYRGYGGGYGVGVYRPGLGWQHHGGVYGRPYGYGGVYGRPYGYGVYRPSYRWGGRYYEHPREW